MEFVLIVFFLQPKAASLNQDLLGIAAELLKHVHVARKNMASPSDPHDLAAAALAAAEANAAMPPLSAAQRKQFHQALEEVAKHAPETLESILEEGQCSLNNVVYFAAHRDW